MTTEAERRSPALPSARRAGSFVVSVTNRYGKRTLYGSRQGVGFTNQVAADQAAGKLTGLHPDQTVDVEEVVAFEP